MSRPQTGIIAPSSRHAIFITLHLRGCLECDDAIRQLARDAGSLIKDAGEIDPAAATHATIAFGAAVWQRLLPDQVPSGLREFLPIGAPPFRAPATGGDLFLHLHGARHDLLHDLAERLLSPLRPVIESASETHGFRYHDERDLTGFIDGTENPQGNDERTGAAIINDDSIASGGSFLLCQRYCHHIDRWQQLNQTEQEGIIGRTREESIELSDDKCPASAHIRRVVIEEGGEELEIVRHSMPYGEASGDKGLFFLAYSNQRATFDKMLGRMFGTSSDGMHDRLMEFSQPVSGAYFFAPSLDVLEQIGQTLR